MGVWQFALTATVDTFFLIMPLIARVHEHSRVRMHLGKVPLLGGLAVAFIAIILALLCRRFLRSTSSPINSEVGIQASATPAAPLTTPLAQRKLPAKQLPGGPPEPSDPRWKAREIQRKIDPNSEWRMPISFYGRVVDENDRPIPTVKVEFSWTDLSSAGNSTSATLSDSAGTFSLEGQAGRVLQVDVSKDGYYKPRNERLKSFDYAGFWESTYHEPDPARPVIFHLRSKGKSEALSIGEVGPTPFSRRHSHTT
jgi:hypothetical protein